MYFLSPRSSKQIISIFFEEIWVRLSLSPWRCLCYTILISDCHAIEWCREKNLWQLLIFFARNTGYRRVVLNFLVFTVYRFDSKTLASLYLWYSKASRYVFSRCTDLADAQVRIGSKKIKIPGFYSNFQRYSLKCVTQQFIGFYLLPT